MIKKAEKSVWDNTWNKLKDCDSVTGLDRLVFKKICELVDFRNKEVVELGCGRGALCFLMLRNGAKTCTLVDFSASALNIARSLFDASDNVEFINSDFFSLKENKKYDIVFSFGVAEHFSDKLREDVIFQHCRITKDIAVLIVPARPHFNTIRQRKKKMVDLYGWQYAFSKEEMYNIVNSFDGYEVIVNKRFYPLYAINLTGLFVMDDKVLFSRYWNLVLQYMDIILTKMGIYKFLDILLYPFSSYLGGLLITVIKKR